MSSQDPKDREAQFAPQSSRSTDKGKGPMLKSTESSTLAAAGDSKQPPHSEGSGKSGALAPPDVATRANIPVRPNKAAQQQSPLNLSTTLPSQAIKNALRRSSPSNDARELENLVQQSRSSQQIRSSQQDRLSQQRLFAHAISGATQRLQQPQSSTESGSQIGRGAGGQAGRGTRVQAGRETDSQLLRRTFAEAVRVVGPRPRRNADVGEDWRIALLVQELNAANIACDYAARMMEDLWRGRPPPPDDEQRHNYDAEIRRYQWATHHYTIAALHALQGLESLAGHRPTRREEHDRIQVIARHLLIQPLAEFPATPWAVDLVRREQTLVLQELHAQRNDVNALFQQLIRQMENTMGREENRMEWEQAGRGSGRGGGAGRGV
jgi:hypothetical protein